MVFCHFDDYQVILRSMNQKHSKNIHKHEKEEPHLLLTGWRFKTLIFTIVLSAIAYFLFTLWGGWQDVVDAVVKVGIKGILIALLLSLVNYFLRFLRWQNFLNRIGHPIPFWENLKIYISGFALTTTPGKAGEALRSVFLKSHGVSYRRSFGIFFAERLSDLISVMALTACGLWNYKAGQPLIIGVGILIAVMLGVIQKKAWLKALEGFARKALPEKFSHLIEFFLELILAFRDCFSLSALLYGTFLGIIAWGAEGYAFYYLLQILGEDISLSSSIFVYAFSLFIGGISLLPGGLGGAEVTMWQLLLYLGVSPSVTVAVTIVIRLATLWFSVFLGILALPKQGKVKKRTPGSRQS